MTRCTACDELIDTDEDADCYDIPNECLCWRCREVWEEKTPAVAAQLSEEAEHSANRGDVMIGNCPLPAKTTTAFSTGNGACIVRED